MLKTPWKDNALQLSELRNSNENWGRLKFRTHTGMHAINLQCPFVLVDRLVPSDLQGHAWLRIHIPAARLVGNQLVSLQGSLCYLSMESLGMG